MFGHNDNSQQPMPTSTPDDVVQAAMPDPITPSDPTVESIENTYGEPVTEPMATSAPDLSTPELPSTATPEPDEPALSNDSEDLTTLKQQALQQLSPLVSHLDQTPEEKFRTTMMMIQASDDKTLIKSALEAAQQISDDKARAQALLDVINEINYFTQQK